MHPLDLADPPGRYQRLRPGGSHSGDRNNMPGPDRCGNSTVEAKRRAKTGNPEQARPNGLRDPTVATEGPGR